jgi:maltose alpha-D-glucosyltransferase/alpha-amylase
LLAWVPTRRWFGGKGRSLDRVDLLDHADLPAERPLRLQLIEARYADGQAERYFVPLTSAPDQAADSLGLVALEDRSVVLRDALEDPAAGRRLLDALSRAARIPSAAGGAIDFQPGPALAALSQAAGSAEARPLGAEQSNSTVVFGDALLLKCFRRVYDGPNPDLEVPRFLATRTTFDRLPGLAGAIEYLAPHGPSASLAIVQEFVPNDGDGWSFTLAELAAHEQPASAPGVGRLETGSAYAAAIAALGRVTAELHQALASDPSAPAFAPLPVGPAELADWRQTIQSRLRAGLARLRQVAPSLAEADRRLAARVLAAPEALEALIGGLANWPHSGTTRIRYHGDYHLGQVLHSVRGWLVLDFEGEPLRSLAERRARHCPLRDVAGLLRSLNYAAETARRARSAEAGRLAAWEAAARQRFLMGYLERTAGAAFRPADPGLVQAALGAFELEKAIYELEYELGNRPDWVGIPLAFLAAQSARPRPRPPGARWR